MNQTAPPLPRLAPPGSGIPWIERQIARLLIASRFRGYTKAATHARLGQEHDALRSLAETHAALGTRRVLIPRLRGLEDSSRFWSVFMTLDHLRIVNKGIAGVIAQLGRGETPARRVSIAEVKPSPDADGSVLAAFSASCAALSAAVDPIADPRATPCHPHPWFGPFNAAQWHAMAAFHMRLHHAQATAILQRLGAA